MTRNANGYEIKKRLVANMRVGKMVSLLGYTHETGLAKKIVAQASKENASSTVAEEASRQLQRTT